MNTSKLLFLVICLVALTLTAPLVTAAPRGGSGFSGGHHFAWMPARGGQTFSRSGAGNFRTFNDRREDRLGNRRFVSNRFVSNRFVFVDSFGFPFWGWGWGYPYGYYGGYGYGYPYGYGYDYDYYSQPAYGYGYGNQGYGYGNQGYGYGDQGHGYGERYRGGSSVAQLQRRLARAGYYHGAIDGIMGPETRRAMRAYEGSRNQRECGMSDRY